MTGLRWEEKIKIREEVFQFIKTNNIPIVYSASYVSPYIKDFKKQKNVIEKLFIHMKSFSIGTSLNTNKFDRNLQAEVFYRFYVKSVCFLVHYFKEPLKLSVKTDTVNKKTLKNYENVINSFHGDNTKTIKISKTNLVTKEKYENSLSISSKFTNDPTFDLIYASEGNVEVDSLNTIVADIVTNSLYTHIHCYVKDSNYAPLDTHASIKDFELANHLI